MKQLKLNHLYNGDCLKLMLLIPDGSIDMILADVPYGTTACKWDTIIPLEPMWEQLKRIIKPNGAIVMTASQPFTSKLVMSNMKMFKYEWIWDKKQSGSFLLAKYQPLKITENIVVFSKTTPKYIPQMRIGKLRKKGGAKNVKSDLYSFTNTPIKYNNQYYPTNLIEFSLANKLNRVHPTQKPVALFEYLIKTYTNEGDTVLDFVIGSGTTAVACIHLNRNWLGIELNKEYYEKADERIRMEEILRG